MVEIVRVQERGGCEGEIFWWRGSFRGHDNCLPTKLNRVFIQNCLFLMFCRKKTEDFFDKSTNFVCSGDFFSTESIKKLVLYEN